MRVPGHVAWQRQQLLRLTRSYERLCCLRHITSPVCAPISMNCSTPDATATASVHVSTTNTCTLCREQGRSLRWMTAVGLWVPYTAALLLHAANRQPCVHAAARGPPARMLHMWTRRARQLTAHPQCSVLPNAAAATTQACTVLALLLLLPPVLAIKHSRPDDAVARCCCRCCCRCWPAAPPNTTAAFPCVASPASCT